MQNKTSILQRWPGLLMAAACWYAPGPAHAAPLPELAWGTYIGGDLLDQATAVAVDGAGNIYIVGYSSSSNGIATPGAHKSVGAGADAILVKFDPAGVRLWGTYFGGPGYDDGHGVAASDTAVVIVGHTTSTTDIVTPGAFQPVKAAGQDGFVARFTPGGTLQWGSYLGSSGDDEVAFAAALDDQGATYVAGYATAVVAGLGTAGTYQPAPAGGSDAFVVKFDAQGKRLWGTYYGGSKADKVDAMSLNALGELYIAGNTYSADGIASVDAYKGALTGVGDAFLARLSADGTRVWGTYYGGEKDEARGYVAALPQGGAVLAGTTGSVDGIATAGVHQPALGGLIDGFAARFDGAGARVWGTYYGGPEEEITSGVAADPLGRIYLHGITQSLVGISTPAAFQPALAIYKDAFIASLDGDGQRRWGTYYGGEDYDSTLGVTVDGPGRVVVAGLTKSTTGIATPGAHDTVAADFDGFLAVLTQGLAIPCAGPQTCESGLCVDGVCCDKACGGGLADCQACTVAAGGTKDGACTPLAVLAECRPAANSCDAAESCLKNALTCPDDAPVADGEACEDGSCLAGLCVPEPSTSGETTDTGGETSAATTGNTSTDGTTATTDTGTSTTGASPTQTGTTATGEASATPTEDTSTAPTVTSGGDALPTTTAGPSGGETGSSASTGGDGGMQMDDPGCGCRGSERGGLLGWSLLLWVRRRRRARAGV